jgi:signal transduction histidine kinase
VTSGGLRGRSGAVSVAKRYGVSVAAWIAALALTLALMPYLQRANFVIFWVAVIFTAYRAGLAAAIAASLASVVAVNFYMVAPFRRWSPVGWADVLTFALFVAASALVSVLAARLGQATASLRAQIERNQVRAASEAAARAEAERTAADAHAAAAAADQARAEADVARREAERARGEAEDARGTAESANVAKIHFLASMSHELRTPLNAIQGHVQLIELGVHGPVTEAQREALMRIDRAQRHLLGLVNDVLNYARLGSGRVEYDLRRVRVRQVVDDVLPMLEPQLTARGLRLEVKLPDGEAEDSDGNDAVEVWADREKLGQILLNLLSNAIKFTPAGGRVCVEIASREDGSGGGDVAYLRVSDTGIGIPIDRLDAVFEPFVQVRAGLTRTHEGTGLGLAISRDLARGMGGDLRARSVEGAGSTFTITLRRALHRVRPEAEP